MIDAAIRTLLAAASGVTDLVGGTSSPRIHPLVLPQEPVFPAITYQIISGEPAYDLRRPAGAADTRIQIDCWAQDSEAASGYDQARALAEAVRAALSGFTGAVGSDVIQLCLLVNRRAEYEEAVQVYRESLDWSIGYAES